MRAGLILSILFGMAIAAPAGAALNGLRVEGTRFVLDDGTGKLLKGADLVGAELDLGELGVVRVAAVEQDTSARFKEVWLHTLELRQPGRMLFTSFCTPDPAGDTRVVVYPGYFDADHHYIGDSARFSMSCVSGVEAKCLRWGYLPWRTAPNTGASLAPYYEACIHLARADYCGDNRPSTRDGTRIDIYDRVGVQQQTPGDDGMQFEAGWNSRGAVCVQHTRIPENLTLQTLPQHCARFTEARLGAHCNDRAAGAQGALLFNRSRAGSAL